MEEHSRWHLPHLQALQQADCRQHQCRDRAAGADERGGDPEDAVAQARQGDGPLECRDTLEGHEEDDNHAGRQHGGHQGRPPVTPGEVLAQGAIGLRLPDGQQAHRAPSADALGDGLARAELFRFTWDARASCWRLSASYFSFNASSSSIVSSSARMSVSSAASMAWINSSSFRCTASASRFWVFWIRKTIRNVTIVVPVLMTSCQVSEKPKNGPETAHTRMTPTAARKV